MEDENCKIDKFDMIVLENSKNENESKNEQIKKSCYFPSVYVILICFQILIFILTYIIPKGKFDTIEYDISSETFIEKIYNKTSSPTLVTFNATQDTLDQLGINIKLENFKLGYIKKPVAIPNSYTKLEEEGNNNFFNLFVFPITGMIDSSEIGFFLLMLGGSINILIEMNALTSGMEALSRVTKGHEIILLIVIYILVSIAGNTFGMLEEILSFYPVLMPIFLKSGIDAALAGSSLFIGVIIGQMFSTVNPFSVVIASYSASINFLDGIAIRIIGFVIVDILVIIYFIFYHKKIKIDPTKSVVYDIKEEINNKFFKKQLEDNVNLINENDEETRLKDSNEKDNKPNKFTIIQKISLILYGCSFVLMIVGITALNWWLKEMAAIFLVLGIILMFLIKKGEQKAIEIFIKGSGDFIGVIIILGLAQGINNTLYEGLIQDTLLNGLSMMLGDIHKVVFAMTMFFIFIILGFFIQSCSGLAVLATPVFAPLADKVNCSRKVVVNAYLFGQSLMAFLTPTGIVLIVMQMIGMKYTHWLKFSWLLIIVIFIFLLLLLIIESVVEK